MALPAFLDPLVNLPKPQKIVVGVVILLLLAGAAYWFLIMPLESRIAALEAQRTSLQREVAQSRAIVADLARFRRESAELEKKLAALTERLPKEKEMPPLYRTLSDAAIQAGLGVSLFQPGNPRTRDYYNEVPITLNAEGGYHELGEFFERVARLTRVVTIGDIKLTGVARGRTPVRVDMTLATYIYRPVGSPPAPKPGAK